MDGHGMADGTRATLGGGCFWCLEPCVPGPERRCPVLRPPAMPADTVANPTYDAGLRQANRTRRGRPAHVRSRAVIRPGRHPARLLHHARPDHAEPAGRRYGPAIPQHHPDGIGLHQARRSRAGRVGRDRWRAAYGGNPIVTDHRAAAPPSGPPKPEHQDYFARNPWSGYCRAVITPKVAKLRKMFQRPAQGAARQPDPVRIDAGPVRHRGGGAGRGLSGSGCSRAHRRQQRQPERAHRNAGPRRHADLADGHHPSPGRQGHSRRHDPATSTRPSAAPAASGPLHAALYHRPPRHPRHRPHPRRRLHRARQPRTRTCRPSTTRWR